MPADQHAREKKKKPTGRVPDNKEIIMRLLLYNVGRENYA